MKRFFTSLCLALTAVAFSATALADGHGKGTTSARMAAVQITAIVTAVDKETREVGLELPHGEFTTLVVGEDVPRFDEIAVGDAVVATYVEALAGEVRTPTQEELDEPWVELDAAAVAELDMDPGMAGLRVVRAVCTIEGMNRVTRTAMIQDPRGKYHVITDVEPSYMMGLTLGTRIIMTYAQGMALNLEKAPTSE